MRIAFVCPRYGVEAAGGAEMFTKWLSERLVKEGVDVTVLTTCARDHFGWENYYKPGREIIDGVPVIRFPVDWRETVAFLKIQHKITSGWNVSYDDQREWADESVNSAPMYEYIGKNRNRFDYFIFIPYMFGTTVNGSRVCPEKTLLFPTLHDEVYAYLDIFKEMFNSVKGVLFLTLPEKELAERIYSLPEEKTSVVGVGFDEMNSASAERFRGRYGIDGDFCLYVGRREEGKNTPLLVNYFDMYKRYNGSGLKLVFIGSGDLALPEGRDDIMDLGFVPSADKYDAHAAAMFLLQPSVNESFSITLMDSWLQEAPVIVNSGCAVTKFHCDKSAGGLYFGDYFEFEECVNYFLDNPPARRKMGRNGKEFVLRNYSWGKVLERFFAAAGKFSAGSGAK